MACDRRNATVEREVFLRVRIDRGRKVKSETVGCVGLVGGWRMFWVAEEVGTEREGQHSGRRLWNQEDN